MSKLFDNALMTVTPLALVSIWAELVEAYHGVNPYGSDTAEVYAYRLTTFSPRAHSHGDREIAYMIAVQAANALCSIVEEFCSKEHYDCEAEISGMSVEEWCNAHNYGGGGFYDHRCRIRIIRKDTKTHGSQ